MGNEIEAAGAAITAGAAGGAIDGSEARRVGDGESCANCETPITGKYCVECGQPTHVHRSLFHFLEDAAHSIFHFDTRAWRTLPMAAFRPGTLTRNYVMGKRARYISPVALFLFTVFTMFFVFALMGEVVIGQNRPQTLAELQQNVTEARAEVSAAEAKLTEAKQKLVRLEAAADRTGMDEISGLNGAIDGLEASVTGAREGLKAAEEKLKRREERIAQFKKARAQLDVNEADAQAKNDTETLQGVRIARSVIDRALADPAGPPDGVKATIREDGTVSVNADMNDGGLNTFFEEVKEANARGEINVNTGNKTWDEKIKHKLDNPELVWYKIQNTAYKFSFLLVPISLPFIWLLFFWKRKVTLFDHAVFGLYSLSFMSILFIVLVLVARLPENIAETAAPIFGGLMAAAVPVHMFFQMKGAYQLGWFSALWRTILLVFFAVMSLSIFIGVIFMLGLLG